eukprot:766172-Hanusia_phi.AAC.2
MGGGRGSKKKTRVARGKSRQVSMRGQRNAVEDDGGRGRRRGRREEVTGEGELIYSGSEGDILRSMGGCGEVEVQEDERDVFRVQYQDIGRTREDKI